MMFADLASPAEAPSQTMKRATGFAQAGNRYPLFGIILWISLPYSIMPHGHFTTGGIEERIESTLPPVLRPNTVPRS